MTKKPVARVSASAAKRPSTTTPVAPKGITWRFAKLDHDGPWPLHSLSGDEHKQVLLTLGGLETSTFDELASKRGNKYIPVVSLCNLAQKRLEALKLDDQDGLWEMHVTGKQRAWGFRTGNIMSLLWWDPSHEVCPSTKKNT